MPGSVVRRSRCHYLHLAIASLSGRLQEGGPSGAWLTIIRQRGSKMTQDQR